MPVFCQRGFACGETARAVIGPAFWVCRAKSGAAFRCAKPPCAVVRFAAMASPPRTAILPFPSRLRRAGAPTAKPRPLLPFGRISPAAKPGWPVVAPAGGNVLATPFSLCSNVAPHIPAGSAGVRSFVPRLAPRSHPGACRRSAPFRCAKPRWPVVAPAGGNVLATPFSLCSNVAPRSHPGAQLRFILKQLYASGCPFLRNFPFFSSVPHPFLHRLRGAPIHKNPRRGYPAADLTPFQFPGSIFPSPTPEAVRPPPRRHIFWGFCIAINNFFFPSLIGVVIQLLLRTLPRMPKKESASAFLFCFAPKGSFLPVLHSLFSLPLSFQMP